MDCVAAVEARVRAQQRRRAARKARARAVGGGAPGERPTSGARAGPGAPVRSEGDRRPGRVPRGGESPGEARSRGRRSGERDKRERRGGPSSLACSALSAPIGPRHQTQRAYCGGGVVLHSPARAPAGLLEEWRDEGAEREAREALLSSPPTHTTPHTNARCSRAIAHASGWRARPIRSMGRPATQRTRRREESARWEGVAHGRVRGALSLSSTRSHTKKKRQGQNRPKETTHRRLLLLGGDAHGRAARGARRQVRHGAAGAARERLLHDVRVKRVVLFFSGGVSLLSASPQTHNRLGVVVVCVGCVWATVEGVRVCVCV
jgi:hypothetical protein